MSAWKRSGQTESLIQRGIVPQVTCRPLSVQVNLRNPFIFANLECWNPAFNKSAEEQTTLYPQPRISPGLAQNI